MSFDFHARYGLLTYSQCDDLEATAVNEHIEGLGAQCVIGREVHADGGIHLHCFFDFGRKRRFRRADVFDVRGRHPNIVKSRGTPELGYDYATKDNDIVGGGSLERPTAGTEAGVSNESRKWLQIVAAETRDEFFDLCGRLAPKSLCVSYSNLARYADWKYAVTPSAYVTPSGTFDLGEYPELHNWSQRMQGGANQQSGKFGRSFHILV